MAHGWDNFYITTGTAAATLVGLMFVVITLCASLAVTPAARGVHAFLTPALIHFSGVMVLSLVLLMPWPSTGPVVVILTLHAIAGLSYAAMVTRLLSRLDFIFLTRRAKLGYAGAPAIANLSLLAGSAELFADRPFAPYAIAGGVAFLLLIGLGQSWDVTLWIIGNREQPNGMAAPPSGAGDGA